MSDAVNVETAKGFDSWNREDDKTHDRRNANTTKSMDVNKMDYRQMRHQKDCKIRLTSLVIRKDAGGKFYIQKIQTGKGASGNQHS